ncbi:MAG: hypothetical protein ACJ780_28615 [Solirubrobacteraceae bacterium]
MTFINLKVEDDLAARIRRLAARSNGTLASEVRRALRAWVEASGLDDGAALRAAASSSSPPPPVIPVRKAKQRTTTCIHRRPVSSFCRYCDA